MTKKRIIDLISAEVKRAKGLHPHWPMQSGWPDITTNRIVEAAVVAEEAFEALQVALNMRPGDPHKGGEKGTKEAYRKELIQAGAMVFRALEWMED